MITENDLQEAIAECQGQKNPNSNTCIKLAAFYIIRDHMFPDPGSTNMTYSFDAPNIVSNTNVQYDSGTEFSNSIYGKSIDEVLSMMDDLMSTLYVVNPRLYASVIRKLNSL